MTSKAETAGSVASHSFVGQGFAGRPVSVRPRLIPLQKVERIVAILGIVVVVISIILLSGSG